MWMRPTLNVSEPPSVDAVGSRHFSKYEAHDLSLTSKSRAAAASEAARSPLSNSARRRASSDVWFEPSNSPAAYFWPNSTIGAGTPSAGGVEDVAFGQVPGGSSSVAQQVAAAACPLWAWGSSWPPSPRAASPGVLSFLPWRAVFFWVDCPPWRASPRTRPCVLLFPRLFWLFLLPSPAVVPWWCLVRAVRFCEYRCAAFQ